MQTPTPEPEPEREVSFEEQHLKFEEGMAMMEALRRESARTNGVVESIEASPPVEIKKEPTGEDEVVESIEASPQAEIKDEPTSEDEKDLLLKMPHGLPTPVLTAQAVRLGKPAREALTLMGEPW